MKLLRILLTLFLLSCSYVSAASDCDNQVFTNRKSLNLAETHLLLTALAGAGDFKGVKEKYLTFAKTISDELGLSPSPEIAVIYNHLCHSYSKVR